MKWNVFHHNTNRRRIEVVNVFNHAAFKHQVYELLKTCKSKEKFGKDLRLELQYYFWSKAEYEIVISAWCGGDGKEAIKVDIYGQVMNNWDVFLDYVWKQGKKELRYE